MKIIEQRRRDEAAKACMDCGLKNAEEDDGSSSSSSIQWQSPLNDAVGQQPHAEGNDSARRETSTAK